MNTAPKSADRYRAVFFDAGGTLIAAHPSVFAIYRKALGPLGLDPEPDRLRTAYLATWAEFEALVGRGRNRFAHFPGGEREYWRRYVARVFERLSLHADPDEGCDLLQAAFSDPGAWAAFPDVTRTLSALKARGLRLAVISNWDSRLRGLLEGLGLADWFEEIFVSSEVGVEKPDAAIFEHALNRLGLLPHEAFHVGDDLLCDYTGPHEAGLDAAYLVRSGAPPGGIRAIDSLERLLDHIQGPGEIADGPRSPSRPGEGT